MGKMKPLVLAEFLEAINRVLVTGETDLSIFHARVDPKGQILEFKEGRSSICMRVEDLETTIKALREKGKVGNT